MQLKRLTFCVLVAFMMSSANLQARISTSLSTAPQAPLAEPLSVILIKDGVYWTKGGAGGNTGFVVGRDGVIVFDAKMTPDSAKEMIAAIAKISRKPVTHVILSHGDPDHVNGLSGFPAAVTIIVQENCKKEMEEFKDSRMPTPPAYLPTKIFDEFFDRKIALGHTYSS